VRKTLKSFSAADGEETMMKRMVLAAVVLFSMSLGLAVAEETAQDVLERMKKMYDGIRDAELTFLQKTRFELSKLEQQVDGRLLLKKTNKYRVETRDQTIVTDGETVWSHSMASNQVLVDHFKLGESSISPEKVLTGAPSDFNASLLGREKLGRTDVVVLKLIPRNERSAVRSMKLWVDSSTWLIRRVEIVDVIGKQTEYLVTDAKLNTGIQDSRFTYQVPEGTEVVDLR
jgi:outer membrane lipoprotein carrier protein